MNTSRNQTFNSTLILFSSALSMADMVAPWKSLLWVWNAGFEVQCFYWSPRVVIAWQLSLGSSWIKNPVCLLQHVSLIAQNPDIWEMHVFHPTANFMLLIKIVSFFDQFSRFLLMLIQYEQKTVLDHSNCKQPAHYIKAPFNLIWQRFNQLQVLHRKKKQVCLIHTGCPFMFPQRLMCE